MFSFSRVIRIASLVIPFVLSESTKILVTDFLTIPKKCIEYLSDDTIDNFTHITKLDISQNLPRHFLIEEFALLEAALKSNQKRLVITEKQVENFWPDIFADMTDAEIQAISDPANSDPIDVCNSGIKMYSAIEKMPMTDRVLVARYLMLSE